LGVDSPESLESGVDDNLGGFNLTQVERKRKRFSSGCFHHSGNLLKRLRVACSKNYCGEVASQTDSGGTSDALAGTGHDCDRIFHGFLHCCSVVRSDLAEGFVKQFRYPQA